VLDEVTVSDVLVWLKGSFPVSQVSRGEVVFPCPRCGHSAFYFNPRKRVGYCHQAACHWKPSLDDLIDLIGHGPELAGYVPEAVEEPKKAPEVSFPPGVWPAIYEYNGKYMGDSQIAAALSRRGIFTPGAIRANIHCNNHCIYIPVYEKGDMVQYVGRFIDRKNENNIFNLSDPKSRRYDYISGIPITQYLYDWDRLRLARELTLVENTFNAINYTQSYFHCTSTFGSHLSTRQIDLIKHSRAKTVVFLWDEGANYTQAVRQLRREGVTAAFTNACEVARLMVISPFHRSCVDL
jgi:hypothetical protein